MVKEPKNYVKEKKEVPTNEKPIEDLDIEKNNTPHVKIVKYSELDSGEETIYVQVLEKIGDYKPKKETEAPTIEDAIKTADNYSKTYEIPVLLDNVNIN